MRMPIEFVSLAAVLVVSACGGEDPRPLNNVKGNATIAFDGCPYTDTAIPDSSSGPTLTNYGATVSNSNGNAVSCALGGQGTSLQAHIKAGGTELTITSSDLGAGAAMIFFVEGAGGTPAPISSVGTNNDYAPTCTLTTSRNDTLLTVGSGTIFAEYSCGKVLSSSDVNNICQTKGLFYFTGCSG